MVQNERSDSIQLGYQFHPKESPTSPGYPQLDIRIRDAPTKQHFDPEVVRIAIASGHGGIEYINIGHPWVGPKQYRALLGCVNIEDRIRKEVRAFTFGGQLTLGSNPVQTTCTIKSPAPILDLRETEGTRDNYLLATEIEILYAQRRAAWSRNPEAMESRLVRADPKVLYLAFLQAVLEKMRAPALQTDEVQHLLLPMLTKEIQAFQDRLHGEPTIPRLENVL